MKFIIRMISRVTIYKFKFGFSWALNKIAETFAENLEDGRYGKGRVAFRSSRNYGAPGAFRRNNGKLRRFCVSFIITKIIITKKRSRSSKYSPWAREKSPLKPPLGAYSPFSLSFSSSSSSSFSSSSLASGPTRWTSGAC